MKRFYREASLDETPEGYRVLLDGRAIRTQGGRAQLVPARALGLALVTEWAEQGETIDPARFACRDLADYAIDVIAHDPAAVVATLLGFAQTDTLCYRAFPDEPLAPRQLADWEPLLTAAETRFGVQFVRVSGVIHRPQPAATLAALGDHLARYDRFALAALMQTTSLAASLVIGLAACEPDAPLGRLWDAASLEELWQAELWGKEPEAEARRAHRRAQFFAAARFAELAR